MKILNPFVLTLATVTMMVGQSFAFEIIQLSDNSYNDLHVWMAGDWVVWRAKDGNPAETMLYDGNAVSQLSKDTPSGGWYANDKPHTDGQSVVWMGYYGNYDIIQWNDTGSTKLSTTSGHERNPRVSGSNVVWQREVSGLYRVYFHDGSTITQLSDNTYDNRGPRVSGSNAVWRGLKNDQGDVLFYDGSTVEQLAAGDMNEGSPQVDGSTIVWPGHDGNDWEIFRYDILTEQITQLTDNGEVSVHFEQLGVSTC